MFFPVSKVGWYVATPLHVLVIIGLVGLVLLFWRFPQIGRTLVAISLLGILAVSLLPVSSLLLRPLEDRFPAPDLGDGRPVAGIIVLGGAVNLVRGEVKLSDAGARMTEAVALARRFPEARVIFTGGDNSLVPDDGPTESDAARRLFRSLGLDDTRVSYESASRNTRENALFTRRLLTIRPGERWLLVTSAFHMPRAVGCFRAVGLDVEPVPVDFLTFGTGFDYRPRFGRVTKEFHLADVGIREWAGLLAYWLRGYTDELLPGPAPQAARPEQPRPSSS